MKTDLIAVRASRVAWPLVLKSLFFKTLKYSNWQRDPVGTRLYSLSGFFCGWKKIKFHSYNEK